MIKRALLFLCMNIAVIIVLTIVFTVLEQVFGMRFDLYGFNYISIFIYALIIGFTGSFISLGLSRVIAKRMYKIRIITRDEVHSLSSNEKLVWQVVEDLAERNHIKMPEVGIYEDKDPNAFATGPSKNRSLVAVSTGLLASMNKDAIEGVVGHEMAHVLNGDMVTMTLLQGLLNTFVVFFARIIANIFDNYTDGKFGMLGYFVVNIVLQILFGIGASLIAMKFSRYREFRADEGSARFVGKHKMIAGLEALKSLQFAQSGIDSKMATMKINTPKQNGIRRFFSSHPSLDQRIEKLENLMV